MLDTPSQQSIVLHGITTVSGRYSFGDAEAHPGVNLFACRLRMISSMGLMLTAPVIPEIDSITRVQLPHFGNLSGPVTRHHDSGFEIALLMSAPERAALTKAIELFSETLWTETNTRRASERAMPSNPRTIISRDDDWPQPCLVMDYSRSGAAVSAPFQPAMGETVTIGQVQGEVIRLFDLGFAIRFTDEMSMNEAESALEAPDEWRNAMLRAFPTL